MVFRDIKFDPAIASFLARLKFGRRRHGAEESKTCNAAVVKSQSIPGSLPRRTRINQISLDLDGYKLKVSLQSEPAKRIVGTGPTSNPP
jgi:hypothetical protein